MNRVVCRVLVVAMLGGIAAHRHAMVRTPPDVRQYHERIRAAYQSVPARIEGWVGKDVAVPAQAVQVLDPNLLVSRRFVNVENGMEAGFVLVHCADAHDMAGHFPLRCYPAAGWKLHASRPRTWTAGDIRIDGFEYDFVHAPAGDGRPRSITVANALFRPGGRVFADMSGMAQSIVGAGGQSSGAGQIQVYFDESCSQEQRDAAVVALLAGHRPVVEAILADIGKLQR